MADAKQVLAEPVEEIAEQTQRDSVKVDVVKGLADLALEALHSEDGTIPNERIAASILHPSRITRLLGV